MSFFLVYVSVFASGVHLNGLFAWMGACVFTFIMVLFITQKELLAMQYYKEH